MANKYVNGNSSDISQLLQLTDLTYDGDVISKTSRDELVRRGLAIKSEGWNIITPEGIKLLDQLRFIRP